LHTVVAELANPSIERTCPGKPGHASHVKRLRVTRAIARVTQLFTYTTVAKEKE